MDGALKAARVATVGIFLANGFGVGSWAAAIPAIKSHFALGDGRLGVVLLAVALGAVLLMPFGSLLVGRLGGTGRLTRVAALGFALAVAGPGWAPGFASLLAAAFLLGASNGITDVAMNAHASALEKRWGAAIMSSFHAAFSVGGLLGASLGGLLLHEGVSISSLLSAAAIVVLLAVLIAAPRLGPGATASGTGTEAAFVWPQRSVLVYCVIALFCLLMEGAMTDWSGVYLSSVVRTSNAVAAGGYAAFSLTMVLGRLAGDRVVRQLGAAPTIRHGALLAAAGLLLPTLLPLSWAAIAGFALVGLGLSNVVPAVFSESGKATALPSTGIAMTATTGYLGFLLGPPLIGLLSTHFSLRLGIGFLAGVGLLVAMLALLLPRTRIHTS